MTGHKEQDFFQLWHWRIPNLEFQPNEAGTVPETYMTMEAENQKHKTNAWLQIFDLIFQKAIIYLFLSKCD